MSHRQGPPPRKASATSAASVLSGSHQLHCLIGDCRVHGVGCLPFPSSAAVPLPLPHSRVPYLRRPQNSSLLSSAAVATCSSVAPAASTALSARAGPIPCRSCHSLRLSGERRFQGVSGLRCFPHLWRLPHCSSWLRVPVSSHLHSLCRLRCCFFCLTCSRPLRSVASATASSLCGRRTLLVTHR